MFSRTFKGAPPLGVLIVLLCSTLVIVKASENNKSYIREEPINCYICDTKEDCAASKGKFAKCETNVAQSCLIVFDEDGAVAKRGCSDEVFENVDSYCEDNADKCISCESNGCNDGENLEEFFECIACDSGDDANCLLSPNEVITKKLCRTGCLAEEYRVKEGGLFKNHLRRGCLEDIDQDDRELCQKGEIKTCLACEGANCNTGTFEEHLRCYHCDGEGCEDDIQLHECVGFKGDDQCFIELNEYMDFVKLGCVSDLDEDQVESLQREKKLYICDTDQCNLDGLNYGNTCASCSSTTSTICATNPLSVLKTSKCINIPFTHCYERLINETGVTERGCLYDLDNDSFYDCITESGPNCRVCMSDNCNKEAVPPNRAQCHRCNSKSNPNCESKPEYLSYCPIYKENEGCISYYENGITYRGCASEIGCDSSLGNCVKCSGDACNVINVKQKSEEIYGVLQNLPVTCHTCQGEDCLSGSGHFRVCTNNLYQDCMSVFDGETGQVLRRGCSDPVLEEYDIYCATNPESCFNCKANGCNSVTDPKKFNECLICSTVESDDCLFNPSSITVKRKCTEGCISLLYPNKMNPLVYEFVRSCFEDLDLDDKTACTPDNEKCVQCEGDSCNTDILPTEGRLSCLYCNGADCAAPTSKTCKRYSSEDQCYSYFDGINSIPLKAGCKSDLLPSVITSEIKQYFLCDGDDCNHADNLPKAKSCLQCSSLTDVECATNPSKLSSFGTCNINPYTDCYVRVNEEGHTERGCLQALATEDFIACNNGDPEAVCRICTEGECNVNIFPSQRRRCYRCNSLTDGDCETAPSFSEVCPIYKEDDNCVTKTIDAVTYRDCESEMNCSDSNRRSCKVCKDSNCNTIDLIASDIGDPGLFQALPLNCFHCSNALDCEESLGAFKVCQDNNLQTCTVAFASNGTVIGRGCSDLLDSTCSDLDTSCYDCKSNGCNVATDSSNYIDCLYCDGRTNEQCLFKTDDVTRTRQCYGSCMTILHPRTEDPQPAYDLIRTCLDDLDLDDRTDCLDGKLANCKACSGENCNTDEIGDRISCYQCKDDGCLDAKASQCRSVMENDQCYIEYNENRELVGMGCKSDYDPAELVIRIKAKRLWLCSDENCNSWDDIPKAQICSVCSSVTDESCATSPDLVSSRTTCSQSPITQCYTSILPSGETNRGCAKDLNGDDFYDCLMGSESCAMCVGDRCNNQLYPAQRLSCQVCSSETSADCEVSPDSAQVCALYDENQKCVSKVDTTGTTIRGCSTKLDCLDSDEACRKCSSGNCNVDNLKRKGDGRPGLWQDLPLKCYTCTGEERCKDVDAIYSLCLFETDYCMTVFNQDGVVMKRGCSSGIESEYGDYCDKNAYKCYNCNSNGCNRATSLNDYIDCIYCDSKSKAECVTDISRVGNRRKCYKECMTALIPADETGKYDLVRSCLDDKDEEDRIDCNEDMCKACTDSACNNDKVPEDRLSCYTCDGLDGCEDFRETLCRNYKDDDKCYQLYDDTSNIIKMGCISDLDNDYVESNRLQIYTCEGARCNHQNNRPQPYSCANCSSLNEVDCAISPSDTTRVSDCNSLPNTQCYSRVLSDGTTDRGCISSLTKKQILSCLEGESEDCSVCEGNRCNIEIFPEDRTRCQRCNSKEDPSCAKAPDADSICPRYKKNEGCSVKLVNGATYRGCNSEFTCDDTDKQYCRNCNGTSCNVANLEDNVIGYPGRWDKAPIQCFSCDDSVCEEGLAISETCVDNLLQNCVTVFGENGAVVQRACSDSMYASKYASYCDSNQGSCQFCKSTECNVAHSLDDYVECLACDGNDGEDCVLDVSRISKTRKCYQGCFTALYPRKDEENPAYELERGCWDDLSSTDRENCGKEGFPKCEICTENKCNTNDVVENRLKCLYCEDETCKNYQEQTCVSYRENDQCYILYDRTEIVKMGCLSDLDHSKWKTDFRHIYSCEGDNCNTGEDVPPVIACLACDSEKKEECAVRPEDIQLFAGCDQLPYMNCFVRVSNDGVTYRGCMESLTDELFYECLNGNISCSICNDKHNCNDDIFPKDRRRCLICDSENDPSCSTNPSSFSDICRLYLPDQQCVSKLEGDRTIRGCSTQISCNSNDKTQCSYCSGDDCNTKNLLESSIGEMGLWQELPLECHKCKGVECLDSNLGPLTKCEGNMNQACMTVFDTGNTVIHRDCSDEILENYSEHCEEYPDKCLACKSNGCNEALQLDDYIDCYFCDSQANPKCAINFDSETTRIRKCYKACMIALYPRSSSSDTSFELTRSCLDDMDLDDRESCKSGEWGKCYTCEEPLCNTENFPENRQECYMCSNNDCEDITLQACPSYLPEDQCYQLFDKETNDLLALGCKSDLESDQLTELIKGKSLVLCSGKGCNVLIPEVKTCKSCSSGDTSLCATNPNLLATTERCSEFPYTDCYTRVNEKGETERGCLADLDNEDFYECLIGSNSLCEACDTEDCNALDVFPSNRLRCHQCSSLDDPDCESSPSSNKVCVLYDSNDYCVTSYNKGITTRGCASALTCPTPDDRKSCKTCNGSGCNTQDMTLIGIEGEPGLWQDVPITCLTCKGDDCLNDGWVYRVCLGDPYQNCMTVFNNEGSVIQRGCSGIVEGDQQSYCAANKDKCLYCNSNGCNGASALTDYINCWSCDSKTNPKCSTAIGELSRTRNCNTYCMTAMYPRDKEDNPAYILTRSCLDDMDLDDRDLCLQGKMEYCESCKHEKCNSLEIPSIQRLSCLQCEEGSCEDPQPAGCPFYRENDQCYIRYDEDGTFLNLGCRSEFTNEAADDLLKKRQLLLCSGDNCNTLTSSEPQSCSLCNSRVDKECAQEPSLVVGETLCSKAPYTQCYSRILSDGATERGCLSSLEDQDFLNCLDPNSKNCSTCIGDHCNKEVYPADRLSCHICDSETDLLCTTAPDFLSICPLYSENEMCISAYIDGATHRGCATSLSCDPNNPKGCDRCTTNGCNTINIARRQDDNFGKWQDLPLECVQCDGPGCASNEDTTRITCPDNNEQDCMIVFDESGSVIHRGCSDEVDLSYGSHCDENPDSCIPCKSNECNQATSKSDLIECIYCDSHKDANCLSNPLAEKIGRRFCDGGCMTALYPADGSEQPSYNLIRTCLNDKEKVDRDSCTESVDGTCSSCQTDSCNTVIIPDTRHSCYQCAGDDCEKPTSQVCPLYKENDQCFIWFDDTSSISEMGCLSSFRNQDLQNIIKTKKVWVCDGVDCNLLEKIPPAQKCTVCSSDVDRACAVNALDVPTFRSCVELPYPNCYSRLLSDGNTARGCLSDLADDDFVNCFLGSDRNCSICLGAACNREIFPEDRLQCYTCSSDDDEDCEAYPSYKQPCPFETLSETCITALSGDMTIRGCSSSVYCDSEDKHTCRSCRATECNAIDLLHKTYDPDQGLWQSLPLRCHHCDGEQCKYSLGPAQACVNIINQQCMTVFDESGEVQRRGCEDAVEDYEDLYCRLNPHLCFKCKSNECNDVWDINQYINCTYCSSASDPLCVVDANSTSLSSRSCNHQCMVAIKDGDLIRSCLDDKEIFSQGSCVNDGSGNNCAKCDKDYCNDFAYPSDRLSCHVCSGANCSSSTAQPCVSYDKDDFCFAKYGEDEVELMGCASTQSKQDLDDWRDKKILYECTDSNCNSLDLLPSGGECLACDSSKTLECAQDPSNVKTFEQCPAPSSRCVVSVNSAGHTLRGCFKNLSQEEQDSCSDAGTCEACTGDKCNTQIFPSNRRKCYRCNNVPDKTCEKDPSSLEICPLYQLEDTCISKRDQEGYAVRGCGSELDCSVDDDKKCQKCTTDGCNTDDISLGFRTMGSLALTLILAFIALLGSH